MRFLLAYLSVLLIPLLPILASELVREPLVRWAVDRMRRADDDDRAVRLPLLAYGAIIVGVLIVCTVLSAVCIKTLL